MNDVMTIAVCEVIDFSALHTRIKLPFRVITYQQCVQINYKYKHQECAHRIKNVATKPNFVFHPCGGHYGRLCSVVPDFCRILDFLRFTYPTVPNRFQQLQ